MPQPASNFPPQAKSHAKRAVIFDLENVLIPGKAVPEVSAKKVKSWLSALQKYQKTHPGVRVYLVSGYKEDLAQKKIKEFGLEKYFPAKHVFAVNDAYLEKRDEVDRKLYEAKCADDAECQDHYFKQVRIQALMKDEHLAPESIVLVGHDYWFDGFYTRRFSGVDIAFIASSLTSRGKPAPEKVSGLWYIERDWKGLKAIIEGKVVPPHYGPLDAWVSITLTEELLGGKGLPQLKRVILERKKDGGGFDVTQKTG